MKGDRSSSTRRAGRGKGDRSRFPRGARGAERAIYLWSISIPRNCRIRPPEAHISNHIELRYTPKVTHPMSIDRGLSKVVVAHREIDDKRLESNLLQLQLCWGLRSESQNSSSSSDPCSSSTSTALKTSTHATVVLMVLPCILRHTAAYYKICSCVNYALYFEWNIC